MSWGVVVALLVLVSSLTQASVALAASDVQLTHAADGTLVVIGSGWHPGQHLVISLGQQRFNVRADATGDFELPTGLASYQGELAVHHALPPQLAFAPLPASAPPSFAVLFAWSVAQGVALLGLGAVMALLGASLRRRQRRGRYPRQ